MLVVRGIVRLFDRRLCSGQLHSYVSVSVSAFLLASGVVGLVVGLINIGMENLFLSRVLSILISVAEIGVGVYLICHAASYFAFVLVVHLSSLHAV